MPKLPLINPDDLLAIDIHTHAEEPAMHGDDGYDDFQAKMADYFKSPNKHPPTVEEPPLLPRQERRAVIFRRRRARDRLPPLQHYEMLEVASEIRRADPVRQHRSAQGQARRPRGEEADRRLWRQGFQVPPDHAGFYPNDRMAYPLYEAINDGGAIALFHTGQTGVGSGMPAAWGCG